MSRLPVTLVLTGMVVIALMAFQNCAKSPDSNTSASSLMTAKSVACNNDMNMNPVCFEQIGLTDADQTIFEQSCQAPSTFIAGPCPSTGQVAKCFLSKNGVQFITVVFPATASSGPTTAQLISNVQSQCQADQGQFTIY